MQGYSIAETLQSPQLHLVERKSSVAAEAFSDGNPVLDQLLMQLADLVADRVAARLVSPGLRERTSGSILGALPSISGLAATGCAVLRLSRRSR